MDVTLLLISGALGGLAQALLAGQGKLALPYSGSDHKFDLGFVSDLFIGAMGALAILVIGLAVLNQSLFSTASSVDLTNFPIWMRVMSFGALAGFGSRRLLPALSDKLVGVIEQNVQQKVSEASKSITDHADASASALQTRIDGLSVEAALPPVAPSSAGASAREGLLAESAISQLANLVAEYDTINEPDYRKRVAAKDDVANRMMALVSRSGIQRSDIEALLKSKWSESWVLALAVVIAVRPMPGDPTLLAKYAATLTLKHVMYRVAVVYSLPATRHIMTAEEAQRAVILLRGYLPKADASLTRQIEGTIQGLQSIA